jgi:hypothetical protein
MDELEIIELEIDELVSDDESIWLLVLVAWFDDGVTTVTDELAILDIR